MFPFSRRDGTPAADYSGQIPGNIIKDRVHALSELERDLALNFYNSRVKSGAEQRVLVERVANDRPGFVKGTDQWYIPVQVPGTESDPGRFVRCVAQNANREIVTSSRIEPLTQTPQVTTSVSL